MKSSSQIGFNDKKNSTQGSILQTSSVASMSQIKNVNVGSKDQ